MATSTSITLAAVLQMTLDGRILDARGDSDWVDSWADGLELLQPVNAFVLGGGMFSGYELFWAAMRDDPGSLAGLLDREPYARELEYAQVASTTEHLVLSTTLAAVTWPSARIVRSLEELRTFTEGREGRAYVVGGPTLVTSLLEAGLLDELHLIVHPVLVGAGPGIAGLIGSRQRLELVTAAPDGRGRATLSYRARSSS